jgi:hypothetical protein
MNGMAENSLLSPPNAQLAVKVCAIEQVEVRIGHNVRKLAQPPGQRSNRERSAVSEVKDDELAREGEEEDLPPQRGEAKPRGKERECRERWGGRRSRRQLLLQLVQLCDVPGTAGDAVLLQRDVGAVSGDGGEEEAAEADGAEVGGVEGVAAEAGEVLRRGVEHPEQARVVGRLPDAEQRGPVDGGEEPPGGVADPAEVLHPAARVVEVEPVEHGPRAGVPDGDAAVAVPRGEAERGAAVVLLPLPRRGGGRPAHGGDEGGERRGRHGEHADELHGARVRDDDAAPGAVREQARGAEVGAAGVAAARRAREHRRRGAPGSAVRGGGRHRRGWGWVQWVGWSVERGAASDLAANHHLGRNGREDRYGVSSGRGGTWRFVRASCRCVRRIILVVFFFWRFNISSI